MESLTKKNLELTKKCSADVEQIRLIIEERNVLTVRVDELHTKYVTITKTCGDYEESMKKLEVERASI
jgi:hypothetical protein